MGTPHITMDWTELGLVKRTGLEFWHQFTFGEDGPGISVDRSGHDRHVIAASGEPTLPFNLHNGQPGWYFDGTNSPLVYHNPGVDDAIIVKHLFTFAAAEEAVFTTNRGLIGGVTSGNILTTDDDGSDNFFNFYPGSDVEYRKSDTVYAEASMDAPKLLVPELIEWRRPSGVVLDGIQVGQQLADVTRKWKGCWFETIAYSVELTPIERRRILLHFNLRRRAYLKGVPFYFPSVDLVPEIPGRHAIVFNRFKAEPKKYEDITETEEFDDGSRTFNEIADDTAQRWVYRYTNVPYLQTLIFDTFWDAARLATPFYFKDKRNVVWSNVRIEDYDRDHAGHYSMEHVVEFLLVGYNSIGTYELPPAPPDLLAPCQVYGFTGVAVDGDTVTLSWLAAEDDCTETEPSGDDFLLMY